MTAAGVSERVTIQKQRTIDCDFLCFHKSEWIMTERKKAWMQNENVKSKARNWTCQLGKDTKVNFSPILMGLHISDEPIAFAWLRMNMFLAVSLSTYLDV